MHLFLPHRSTLNQGDRTVCVRTLRRPFLLLVSLLAILRPADPAFAADAPWPRHAIDDSSRGADGVRLKDVNGDGLPDITTGWEEGGVTRVYLHPGPSKVKSPWPSVTVGKTPSVEDAVFVDLDEDGAVDVVSSCEGRTKSLFIHFAPKKPGDYLRARKWTTQAVPVARGRTQWMFALPMQIDGKNGPDIVVGSKGPDGLVGWLEAPPNPRNLDNWVLHRKYAAGWIMSLVASDVDGDGDPDIVVSDRKGPTRGVLWLENPAPSPADSPWREHRIGATDREAMFLDLADLNTDGKDDIIVAVRPDEIHVLTAPADSSAPWHSEIIRPKYPAGLGTAKGVCAGDLDRDGELDLVYSCEHADPPRRGVIWLKSGQAPESTAWHVREISGPEGIKFDRIELVDLDVDGDLDVLTCEERHEGRGLGVIWYENRVSP